MDIVVGIAITAVVAFVTAYLIGMIFPVALMLDMTASGMTAIAIFAVIVYAISSTIYGFIY